MFLVSLLVLKNCMPWLPFFIALHMSVNSDSSIDRFSLTGEDGSESKLPNQGKCFGEDNRNILDRSCLVKCSPVSTLNQKVQFTLGPGSRLFFSMCCIHCQFSGIATVTLHMAFLKAERELCDASLKAVTLEIPIFSATTEISVFP